MVGYGFGIPMSKVLARYLGGDVVIRQVYYAVGFVTLNLTQFIRSMESYGTDAFIHLQTDPNKLFEGKITLETKDHKSIEFWKSFARLYIENGIVLQDKEHGQWMGDWKGAEDLIYL